MFLVPDKDPVLCGEGSEVSMKVACCSFDIVNKV